MTRSRTLVGIFAFVLALVGCSTAPLYERLAPTDQKVLVQQVQERLIERGFDPGPADGVVGAKTLAALKAFQQDRGLPITDGVDKVAFGQVLSDMKHIKERVAAAHAEGADRSTGGSQDKSSWKRNDSQVTISKSCTGLYVPRIEEKLFQNAVPAWFMYAYNESDNRYSVQYDVTYFQEKRNVLGNHDATLTDEKNFTIRAGKLIEIPLMKVNQGGGTKIAEITKVDVFLCSSN